MDTITIKTQLGLTSHVLQKNTEGLSHEDSLTSPTPGGNCANWVVGHIVRTRNTALGLVGKEPLYAAEKFDAYGPVPPTRETALPWDELLDAYRKLQAPLEQGLDALEPEAAKAPAPFSPTGNPDETIGSLLAAIAFHEAYHVGQLGILRRVTGREGAIKSPEQTAGS